MSKSTFRDKRDNETWLEYQFDYLTWFIKEHGNSEDLIDSCGKLSTIHRNIIKRLEVNKKK